MPSLVRNVSVGGSTADVTGLNATTSLTVALWARQRGSTSTDILRHASTANNARDGYRFGFNATEFRFDILGATTSGNYAAIQGSPHRDGRWHHYAVTYDSVADVMIGYVDGNFKTRNGGVSINISANSSCTTIWNPGSIGSGSGWDIFDLQILPDVFVSTQDINVLMDPRKQYPGVKGRYFGLNFRTTAAGTAALTDESGNGNNLTISPSPFQQGEEPPWRQVVGF